MPKVTTSPTDQVAQAFRPAGPTTDDAQADPLTGPRNSVSLSVTASYTNNGGSSATKYTLNGVSYTTIRTVGDNGGVPESHTDIVTLGNVDTTNLAVQASATAVGPNDADCEITAWTVTYFQPGLIVEA